MSIATFNEFVKTIDPSSEGFMELARSASSAPDLAAYAQKQGIELSTEDAVEVIESAKRELEAAGLSALPEDALENVTGGGAAPRVVGDVGPVAAAIGITALPIFNILRM